MPAAIPAAIAIGGMLMQAKGQTDAANADAARGQRMQNAANFEADQLDVNAGQAKAAAQRSAENVQLQSDVMQSRGLALAAAGGGGASDPSIVNLMARNAGMGAYQKAVALYGGDTTARDMQLRSEATRYGGQLSMYDGQTAANAGRMAANVSLLKGGASLFSKYAQPTPYESNASGIDTGNGAGMGYTGGDNSSAMWSGD